MGPFSIRLFLLYFRSVFSPSILLFSSLYYHPVKDHYIRCLENDRIFQMRIIRLANARVRARI